MSQINFKDETLDASDGVTKLLLAAEYWKEKASALLAKITEMEQQEPVAWRTFDGEGGYDYRSYEDNFAQPYKTTVRTTWR